MKFLFEPDFLRITVVFAGIVIAIAGLTFFALRRRDEILTDYFTHDEADLEEDFFRRRAEKRGISHSKKPEAQAEESITQPEKAQWGDE